MHRHNMLPRRYALACVFLTSQCNAIVRPCQLPCSHHDQLQTRNRHDLDCSLSWSRQDVTRRGCAGPRHAQILRVDRVADVKHVRTATVDTSALGEGDSITCHAWSPAGHLLVGTQHGSLYIARNAAPAAGPAPGAWGSDPAIALATLFADELSRWSAGGIANITLASQHAILTFEGPDGSGAVMLWLQDAQPQLTAHVKLPVGAVRACALSPDRKQLAITDARARTVVVAAAPDASGSTLNVVSQAHGARIVASGAVRGTGSQHTLVASVDVAGSLHAWTYEADARITASELAPRLTLTRTATLGTAVAAMALHPQLPIAAVAYAIGAVQLLNIAAFAGLTSGAAAQGEWVQFSAKLLPEGHTKMLAWSVDGQMLAAADGTCGAITLLRTRQHRLRAGAMRLELMGAVPAANVHRVQWHLDPGTSAAWVIAHLAQGRLLIFRPPSQPADAADWMYADSELLGACYRLSAPWNDFCVLPAHSGDGCVAVLAVAKDRSIRRHLLPCAWPAGRKGGALCGPVLVAPVDAEKNEVRSLL